MTNAGEYIIASRGDNILTSVVHHPETEDNVYIFPLTTQITSQRICIASYFLISPLNTSVLQRGHEICDNACSLTNSRPPKTFTQTYFYQSVNKHNKNFHNRMKLYLLLWYDTPQQTAQHNSMQHNNGFAFFLKVKIFSHFAISFLV